MAKFQMEKRDTSDDRYPILIVKSETEMRPVAELQMRADLIEHIIAANQLWDEQRNDAPEMHSFD